MKPPWYVGLASKVIGADGRYVVYPTSFGDEFDGIDFESGDLFAGLAIAAGKSMCPGDVCTLEFGGIIAGESDASNCRVTIERLED